MSLFNRKSRRELAKTQDAARQAPVRKQPQFSDLPEDLQNHVGAVRACDTLIELLRYGLFPGSQAIEFHGAFMFVEALRTEAKAKLKAHPQYNEFFGVES